MSNKSGISDQVVSLPQGGGALHGIGEKFSPDLHTGTGNFTVPIALPPGRNGFQPQLNLVYSTGNGNGSFGLGWGLSIPGVSRKTSKGVPRYCDYDAKEESDVFILSGAEDLVPTGEPTPGVTHYRPRTEGLFAQIEHHHGAGADHWEVCSKDGLVSIYGTPGKLGDDDPAAIARDDTRKFAWKLTETHDPFGNRIIYTYVADRGQDSQHAWNQPLLSRIEYADFEESGTTRFLISVSFDYGPADEHRPDPFSDYRASFEIRTTRRCKRIEIRTRPNRQDLARDYGLAPTDPALKDHILVRAFEFTYQNEALNSVSLLKAIEVVGYDDAGQHPNQQRCRMGGSHRFGQITSRKVDPDPARESELLLPGRADWRHPVSNHLLRPRAGVAGVIGS